MASQNKTAEDLVLMHQGASVADLSTIFNMSPQEVNKRIVGKVPPSRVQGKSIRYQIRDAAPFLVNVAFDPEEIIKNMAPEKLPSRLQKAFWEAQLARTKFEVEKGDLWSTQRVVEVLGKVFKAIRIAILMFNDTVEQETALSPEQRVILVRLGDRLLANAHKQLVEQFANYVPPADEHGRTLHEEVESDAVPFDDGFGDE